MYVSPSLVRIGVSPEHGSSLVVWLGIAVVALPVHQKFIRL